MPDNTEPSSPPLIGPDRTLGIIGAGVMGITLAQGLLSSGLLTRGQMWASAKTESTRNRTSETLGIPVEERYLDRVPSTDVVLICVKPAQIGSVLENLKRASLREDTLLISILTGVTLETLETSLGAKNPWVRAMPNTPCIVGEGMTVICGGSHANVEHLAKAQRIFEAVGKCLPVDETYFNAITALSGCGPAYQYLIIEAMADAGVSEGLPRQLALTLVAQTALGAAKMVQTTGRHPASLRDDVTTPAGCTIGGVLKLEDGKLRSVLAQAIHEATRIAGKLGAPAK
ncbi:MAG TPA: pyrroline-5-carboxylate reductase [Armatimonadota bacterium]|jgi:pyrroline-5-carboxylate reductase